MISVLFPLPHHKLFVLLKWKVLYMYFLFYRKKTYRISFLCAHMLPFLCILFILISYEYGRVEKFFFSKTSHAFDYKPPFPFENNFSGLHPSHSTHITCICSYSNRQYTLSLWLSNKLINFSWKGFWLFLFTWGKAVGLCAQVLI